MNQANPKTNAARSPWWRIAADKYLFKSSQISVRRRLLSVIFFVVIGLLLSLVIISAVGIRTENFFLMFTSLFNSQSNTQNFIYQIAIYTLAGLAFSFAMNVGIFNIGISGQMLAGASTAFLIINSINKTTSLADVGQGAQIITLLLCVVGAVAVALVTGLLKIYLKVNEVVSAILLNWIILFLVAYLIHTYDLNQSALTIGNFQSNPLPPGFAFYLTAPQGSAAAGSFIYGSGWLWSIAITVVAVVAVWFVMKFTVFGHKLKTTGLSSSSAKYFGYSEQMLQLGSFAISGAIAGILGAVVYTGQSSYLNFASSGNTALNAVPPEGFNGIAIGLIALNNPIGILVVSVLFSFVNVGANPANLPSTTISLVTGIMMYIIAIYQLSLYLRPWRWYYLSRYTKANGENYLNFENYMGANVEKYQLGAAKLRNNTAERLLLKKRGGKKPGAFVSFFAKPFYAWFAAFRDKGYREQKAALRAKYLERRADIVSEFRYSCAYGLIIDAEQRLNANKPLGLERWEKLRKKIDAWTIGSLNVQILGQLDKHKRGIEAKIKHDAAFALVAKWEKLLADRSGKPVPRAEWGEDLNRLKTYAAAIGDPVVKSDLEHRIKTIAERVSAPREV